MEEYEELILKDEPNTSNTNSLNKKSKINFEQINMENFEDNLNISDIKDDLKNNQIIEQTPSIQTNKCLNFLTNKSIDKDFSEDLDDINEEFTQSQKNITISSFQSEEFNCNNDNENQNNNKKIDLQEEKKIVKKLTKEDLNNIPLPLFSCIYCSNEALSFNHISLEIISSKYLLQTSIYDIKDLNSIILTLSHPLLDKDPHQNDKLLDIIIKNTEYISHLYEKDYTEQFFKSNNFTNICNKQDLNNKKFFTQRIEESIIRKKKDFYFRGINKISKNSLNNRCLFNSMNSFINNYNGLSGFVEPMPVNNMNINAGKNNTNINNSNISLNFNSISLNNNETANNCKENNLLVSIVEHIENNNGGVNEIDDKEEIIDIFGFDKFDLERKITKDNIIWDNNCYDIWNPIISDDDILEEENNNDNNYIINLKTNEYCHYDKDNNDRKKYKLKVNLLKSKTSNNSFNNNYNYQINNKLSVSHIKSLGSTNSSSVINNDNENKIKTNKLNYSKDINISSYNSLEKPISVNTIQMNNKFKKKKNNNSVIINNNSLLKSKNIINNSHIIKKENTNIFKKNSKNNLLNKNNTSKSKNSYVFDAKKSYNSKNKFNLQKYLKKKINFQGSGGNDYKKISVKNKAETINSKNKKGVSRKLNDYKANKSYLYKNYINKTYGGARLSNANNNIISNNKNFGNKIISSTILFKQNANKTINNNLKKSFQFANNNNILNKSKFSFVYDKASEKTSIEKIRAKISEINKFINNNKNIRVNNYQTNNKNNSIIVNNNQNQKNSKIKKKYEIGSTYFTNNVYKKINNTNNNICINKNSFLPSFINLRSKIKIVE